MSDRPIHFAVVGLGMGVQHCKDLRDARGCELVAVCDASPERLEKNRQEFGVRAYGSYEELLRDPDVDVVNICTPSGTHADLSIQALRAGKHVVCEKPPDVSVEAVDRMIAAQRETGRKLMVIFQSRFEPLNREIKAAIDAGRLGRLVGVHGTVHWYRPESYFDSPGKWKGTWKLDGGGSLANQGVHTADLVQWLGGPVTEVYGKFGVFLHDIESEDKTAAVLTFANGALGTLTTTTAAYPGIGRSVFVHGTRGSILIEDDELVRWRLQAESEEAEKAEEQRMLVEYGKKERDVSTASDPFAFAVRLHLKQFEAMAEAIRTDTPPPNSIETTRHTVEILNAVYESGRTGLPVKLGPSL
ncbi:MAG TPA: Gfo/Idh/MocA family oxidoreductase [Armatimonadota bacterium]|nr:Gfo/Idh/MocA family oxidoreductase [Armatimonadota bacterium]